MKLILVKHSMPEIDPSVPAPQWHLGELGRARSELLADKLSEYPLDVIVSSVEPKAIETAQIVANRLHKPFETGDGLYEHDRSNVPFLGKEELESRVMEFFNQPSELVLGLETADQAHERFSNAVARTRGKHPQKNIAIVAHGTVITLFVSRFTMQDSFDFWTRLGLPSFVILNVNVSPNGDKQSAYREFENSTAQTPQRRLAVVAQRPFRNASMTVEKVVENV